MTDPAARTRIRAAWLYYIEGKTQSDVAKTLGVNRIAVTRMLSEARRRGEVVVRIRSDIAETTELERRVETAFGIERVVLAPFSDPEGDPTQVIAAAAGAHVSALLKPRMTVGVGWGRTLHSMLPYLEGRELEGMRVISLLGGIAQARRFNPAEFAWAFAELFDAEGFLVPAPALVDSPVTRHALLEHCGLDQILQMAETCDLALLSCGGISQLTTSFRSGHVSEAERASLIEAGAVGDVLYNFIDAAGAPVAHPVNARAVSISAERLARIGTRVLISGGPEKRAAMIAALHSLRPTQLVTDEQTALRLLEDAAAAEAEAAEG